MEQPADTQQTFRKPRAALGSWTVSLLLHAGFLLVLAGLTFLQPSLLYTDGINATLGENLEPPDIKTSEDMASFRAISQGGRREVETAASRIVSRITQVSVSAPHSQTELLSTQNDLDTTSPILGECIGVQLGKVGGGNGDGDGLGGDEGSGMFGPPGNSSSFVFVLDRSGSMNSIHRESGGMSRFQRLQLELVKFISQLQPTQQFFVIFFNNEAVPMPAESMVPATDYNKARYLDWIARLEAEGETDPRYSLKLAMKLRPDQIYFLSDGDVADTYRKQMLRLDPGKWQLNTFTFGTGVGTFMKSFAHKHNGKYTLIR